MSNVVPPSPTTTLVILIGASEWPQAEVFRKSEAFAHAAQLMREYFLVKFGLPVGNLLDLFDTNKSYDELDEEISNFLLTRNEELKAAGTPVRDVIIYYVGHGGFADRSYDYYLAIRRTRKTNPLASSISIKSLALNLKENARFIRRIIILDCCFSAAAFKDFQSSGPVKVAEATIIEALQEAGQGQGYPQKGTALLCSSPRNLPSVIAPNDEITKFTEGLIHALTTGKNGQQTWLSLRDLAELVEIYLRNKYVNDFPRPEVHAPDQTEGDVSQVEIFPNFASISSQQKTSTNPNNLPRDHIKLIGRKREKDDVIKFINEGSIRLVNLIGTGGTGKSLLVQHVARELLPQFEDGTFIVRLSSISSTNLVSNEIARSIQAKELSYHRESKGKEPASSADSKYRLVRGVEEEVLSKELLDYLQHKRMLLILENFEQVMVVAEAMLTSLLNSCPKIVVILTSQQVLPESVRRLHYVEEYDVGPLETPENEHLADLVKLSQVPAVELFLEHAKTSTRARFVLNRNNALYVLRICQYLSGLPLAIEVAAGQADALPIKEIFLGLEEYGVKTVDYDEKLRTTFDSSYKLLKPEEKALFRYMSIFDGGATFDAIKFIYRDLSHPMFDMRRSLTALVRKRLLIFDEVPEGRSRYQMLRPLQNYAQVHLETDQDEPLIRLRYAQFYLNLVKRYENILKSVDRRAALIHLEAENVNLRAVLQSKKNPDLDKIKLEMAGALFWFWNFNAHFSEGRKLLFNVLKSTRKLGCTEARAKCYYGIGGLAFLQGDYAHAYRWLLRSVRIWRKLDVSNRCGLGYALILLGMVEGNINKIEEARNHEEQSIEIFRRSDDYWGLALALNDLGNIVVAQGVAIRANDEADEKRVQEFYREGHRYYIESLKKWEEIGDDWGLPLTLTNLGTLACRKEDYTLAGTFFERALQIHQRSGDKWGRATALLGRGKAAAAKGDYIKGALDYKQSLILHWELGRTQLICECLEGLATIAIMLREFKQAAQIMAASKKLRDHGKLWDVPGQSEHFQSIVNVIRESLEEDAFKDSTGEGRSWKEDEIVTNVESFVTKWVGRENSIIRYKSR